MTTTQRYVLNAFPEPPDETYGFELLGRLMPDGIGASRLYPTLERLEFHGWVAHRVEKPEECEERPPRTMFYLTADGARWRLAERQRKPHAWPTPYASG